MASTPRPLSELAAALPAASIDGDGAVPVTGLSFRAEDAGPGTLFFCVPGTRTDGHVFASDAVTRGATVVVAERGLDLPGDVTQVLVPSVREAMGPLSAAFYGRPSDRLVVVGVTGTNGKTTTTYLLERIFEAADLVPGVIGTTGVRIAGRPVPHARTTPEAPELQALLADMVEGGVRAVAMEASSHGLDQHRVDGTRFACAVFTNLSQDHLDYHVDLEDYFTAKARLFTVGLSTRAAINVDHAWGRRLARDIDPQLPRVTFGTGPEAQVRGRDVRLLPDGLAFRVDGVAFRSRLRGAFNVENCLGALAAARQVGIEDRHAAAGIAALDWVPGRLQPVDAGQPFTVLVDYAHTPDSLEHVLRSARSLGDRVIVVFGCGGDRDRGKRPLMGEAATRLADLTVVTSDNPRSEPPQAVIEDILPGARRGGGAFVVEPDRRAAIRQALAEARAGDVVIIAGKGHETGQEFAGRTVPFDDRAVAREELEAAGLATGGPA